MSINLAPTLADAFKQIRAFVAERPLSKFKDSRGGTIGGTRVICCDNPSIPSIGWSCYRIATDDNDQILLDENGEQREESILVQVRMVPPGLELGDLDPQEAGAVKLLLGTSYGKQLIAEMLTWEKPFTLDTDDLKHEGINELLKGFEPIRVAFCEATTRYLSEMVVSYAARVVEIEPDVTASLSDGELKRLKRTMQMIVEEIPLTVNTWLDNDKLWWHRQIPLPRREALDDQSGKLVSSSGIQFEPSDKWSYNTRTTIRGGRLIPKPISDVLRYIFANAFTDFEQKGYLKNTTWKKDSLYVGTLYWSQEMLDFLAVYNDQRAKVWSILETASAVETLDKRKEAKKRWNAA